MKVPSTTTLSFPTLSPLLTTEKKYSQILFGQIMNNFIGYTSMHLRRARYVVTLGDTKKKTGT
jgi:hypothetical protein